jgi:CheY-like chemotaxis protein
MIMNLLSNAATAIEQSDRRRGTIWVRTHRTADTVTIEVSDDGCGMAPADFSQLRRPLVTGWKNRPSTGLGLATCDRVLSMLGGSLEMAPRRGGGTTFVASIPVATTSAAPPVEQQPPSRPTGITGRPRVLVVDDERSILVAFSRLLSTKYEVTTAESIDKLEGILDRGQRFDLVLCDLMMPHRSIIEAYDDIRKRHPWVERRLVICTGGGFSEDAKRFVGDSRLRLLDKPFSITAIDAAIEELSGLRSEH